MIADHHEGRPACSRCVRLGACPTPQACEQAEIDRAERAAWRDFRVAAALIVALAVVILAMTWGRA